MTSITSAVEDMDSTRHIGLMVRHPDVPGAILAVFDPARVDSPLGEGPTSCVTMEERSTLGDTGGTKEEGEDDAHGTRMRLKCMHAPWTVIDQLDETLHLHEIIEGSESLPHHFDWTHHQPPLTYWILPCSEVEYFQGLRRLNLSSNALATLPLALFTLSQLVELNLGHNHLTRLSPLIGCLCQLEELYLNRNKLETLPSTLARCEQLRVLDLSENQLAWLPAHLAAQSLRNLWLDHNRFYVSIFATPPLLYQPVLAASAAAPRLAHLALQAAATHLRTHGVHAYCRHAPHTHYPPSLTPHLLQQLARPDASGIVEMRRQPLDAVLMALVHSAPDPCALLHTFLMRRTRDATPAAAAPTGGASPWGLAPGNHPLLSPRPTPTSPLSAESFPSPPSAYQHYCLVQILPATMLWSLLLPSATCSACQGEIYLSTPLVYGTLHCFPTEQWVPVLHYLCSPTCANGVTSKSHRKE